MSLFNISYYVLVRQMTPGRLFKGRLKALLYALVAPVVSIYSGLMSTRAKNLYRLAHSSQVVSMEAVLNDAFDATLRRIVIVDGPVIDAPNTYVRDELKPLYLHRRSEAMPIHIYLRNETAITGVDFIVQVPAAVIYDTERMRALINDYRLASKKDYTIIAV